MWCPESALAVAQQWTDELYTLQPWRRDPDRQVKAGEAGGFIVRAHGFAYKGYLKPGHPSAPDHPRAANEKIIADLARLLDLPVPPTLLYRRTECPADQEPRACVSLILYPEQWEWREVAPLQRDGGPAWDLALAMLAKCSGIVALDTFIGNTDRNNDRNAIFGIDRARIAESTFMFLDHANSLNYANRWSRIGWDVVEFPPLYSPLRQALDLSLIAGTAARIEALEDRKLVEIVQRIPEDYMGKDHKDMVLSALLGRRTLVRPALLRELPGLEG